MTGRVQITIAGAGAWGTALAASFCARQGRVVIWGRDGETVAAINTQRRNRRHLGDLVLPDQLQATTDFEEAMSGTTHLVLAVPAQKMRGFLGSVAGLLPGGLTLICAAKGIEQATGATMTHIMREVASGHQAHVLSGPSFATDLAAGLPTAVTVAGADMAAALGVCHALSNATLRCYASDDVTGVELGGALKNVLAIAAGIVDGRGLGASARAAVITRGFAEMTRLATALGARSETLAGLSGLGDLVLTASSTQSRNFAYGRAIGSGAGPDAVKLAEGVATAAIAAKIARDRKIDAPLIDTVAQILHGTLDVESAIATLLSRPLKPENE